MKAMKRKATKREETLYLTLLHPIKSYPFVPFPPKNKLIAKTCFYGFYSMCRILSF
jgi:hypothetical protein